MIQGTIYWHAGGGFCEGVTFRRPPMSSSDKPTHELLCIKEHGKIDVISSVFDNGQGSGPTVSASGRGMKGIWRNVIVNGGSTGVSLDGGAGCGLIGCLIRNQSSYGVVCDGRSKIVMTNCKIQHVGGVAVIARHGSQAKLNACKSKEIEGDISFADVDSMIEFA